MMMLTMITLITAIVLTLGVLHLLKMTLHTTKLAHVSPSIKVLHEPPTVEAVASVRHEADLLTQLAVPVQYIDESLLSNIPQIASSDGISSEQFAPNPDHPVPHTLRVHVTGVSLDTAHTVTWTPDTSQILTFSESTTPSSTVAPFNEIEGSVAMLGETPSALNNTPTDVAAI